MQIDISSICSAEIFVVVLNLKYYFNPFNDSCSKLLLFKEFSAILV